MARVWEEGLEGLKALRASGPAGSAGPSRAKPYSDLEDSRMLSSAFTPASPLLRLKKLRTFALDHRWAPSAFSGSRLSRRALATLRGLI